MSDRRAELVRQRALIEDHLAWLNRQIAEATPPAPAAQSVAPTAGPATPSTTPLEPDDFIAQYRTPPVAVRENVRKGCFLYLIAAFVVLGLGVAVFYLLFSSRS